MDHVQMNVFKYAARKSNEKCHHTLMSVRLPSLHELEMRNTYRKLQVVVQCIAARNVAQRIAPSRSENGS